MQDQWTVNRLTINGALRYDYVGSRYNPTCVGPNAFVSAERAFCTEANDGVSFHNITPRWGVAWDVFGDGRTAIKWNMGKYLGAAGFSGIYNGVNIARRTVNSLSRRWVDHNGDRIPDCDWNVQGAHGDDGDPCGGVGSNFRRFGRDPLLLDAAGMSQGLGTIYCGQDEARLVNGMEDYCARAGQNVFQGWDKRRSEWQFGLGVQRELLPRLSAEVTYNQRWYQNQTVNDVLNLGCDLYESTTQACQDDMMNFDHPHYSFYRVRAPEDPRLPGGGGYWITGLTNRATESNLPSSPTAVTIQNYTYGWKGVDTNFVLRARGGLRLNGGTSTGKSFRDTCMVMNDAPQIRMREGGRGPQCAPWRPFQTNVRGSVAYTIPWVDVLASAVFQSRPGPEISANMTFELADVVWEPGSEWRATNTQGCAAGGTGCFFGGGVPGNIGLLDASDVWGSRYNLVDLKLAKNIRFARRRVNLGVEIYNLFNPDAIVSYNSSYQPQETHDPQGNPVIANPWRSAQALIAPRFARFAVQFDF